jgi:hypothetical protein
MSATFTIDARIDGEEGMTWMRFQSAISPFPGIGTILPCLPSPKERRMKEKRTLAIRALGLLCPHLARPVLVAVARRGRVEWGIEWRGRYTIPSH